MMTYAEYIALKPLPYFGASSITEQIDGYINQQEWIPESTGKRRPRQSKDDLRRHKCKARYKAQFENGMMTIEQLAKNLGIEKQSVRLKLREYIQLGYVVHWLDTKSYEWIEETTDD